MIRKTKRCKFCLKLNRKKAKYCSYCGNAFPSPVCDKGINHPRMRQNPKTLSLYTMSGQ